jgi:hypothetical protein
MGLIASAHELAGGSYSWWWLWRQGEVESFHAKLLVWVGLGAAAQDQGAAVGGAPRLVLTQQHQANKVNVKV